ncbi:MAG TPA: adenylate/guanylate cyclase domain-containing protein [Thermodesulfobacteriota bacterium]|nr:adenylate/guanylate cyclase domain-containing protein [Thermodesulfobacteriota bacterium]
MTTQEVKRKLAAILSADVKGYSRLMGEDEEWTVRTLNAYREVMGSLIQQHRGRVIDTAGDSILTEFASVVDAVQCAVEIQQVLRAKNAMLPETRRMEFRIGINLGDVIEEGKQIYGDGVNIAARVEGLAEAGGICISGSAYEQIENKLPLRYDYLGEHEVKNIAKPVRVYRAQIESEAVARKPLEVASKEKMAFPLPDKPSIAVLPFVNMSEDPKQEFFSDGMTEEIITALSKSPYLFVIARQSTFTYKGKPVRVKQVSEELGVRYVLEGSVRRSGEKVRITAQLIDAITGYHLWAERYDRDLKEIFALQDEIALKIMKTVHEKLQPGDHARVVGRGTRNLGAFLKAMEAREHFHCNTKEDNALARELYEEVIALDPDYAFAYAGLAWTYMADSWLGTSKSRKESLGRAIELGKKAIALDESEAMAYAALGFFYAFAGQFDMAVVHAERGLALDPNSSPVLAISAVALAYSGRPEEAIPLLQKAIRLNPLAGVLFFNALSVAYRMVGRYDEAVEQAKKAVELGPKNQFTYLGLASACILAGREEEARAAAAQVLKIDPTFSAEQYAKILPFRDKSQIDRTVDAWRKAGLK